MIAGFPISWLVVEFLSYGLFVAVLVHASRQKNATVKMIELFAFVVGAAIFENAGVLRAHAYSYDLRRLVLVGSVPLQILMLEAVIWYAAFTLVERLALPDWAKPFGVGLFGSVQDMTIDPAAVFDRYALTDPAQIDQWNTLYPGSLGAGGLSGQWNWTNPGYSDMFFNIPWYNFSGWMYLMFYFTLWVLLGRWTFSKLRIAVVGWVYPFVGSVLVPLSLGTPINVFLLFGVPFFPRGSMVVELGLVCFNFGLAMVILFLYRKRLTEIVLKRDGWVVFGIPVFLHLFDAVYAFGLGTAIAYVPVVVVSLIHLAYLVLVFRGSHKRGTGTAAA